uniref:Uncharacterized protein n=1 Tax=Meloidogyne floridensis TaxID=298350 RepID=A0A915P362_9BILA
MFHDNLLPHNTDEAILYTIQIEKLDQSQPCKMDILQINPDLLKTDLTFQKMAENGFNDVNKLFILILDKIIFLENYYLNKIEFKFEKWQQILQINIIQHLLNLPTSLKYKDIEGEASSSNNNINQLWSDPIFVQQFKINSIEESKKFKSILLGSQSSVHSNQQIVESSHYKIPVLWAAECAADLVLGINRCIEMAFPNIAEILFYGKRIYIWIFFCNLYGFYWLYFRHPYIFNGIAFAVLFEPLIGYIPFRAEIFKRDLFENSLNNALLAVVTPIIYVLFIICFFFKTREVSDRVTKEEKMVSKGVIGLVFWLGEMLIV